METRSMATCCTSRVARDDWKAWPFNMIEQGFLLGQRRCDYVPFR
ncbi:hypothetical protein BH10PSE15_BH10PSE15_00570 [soil metagenome]